MFRKILIAVFLVLSSILPKTGFAGHRLFGVSTGSNPDLVQFDGDSPGTILSSVPITGLSASNGEFILAIDFRPSTGRLYALGRDVMFGLPPPPPIDHLYIIDTATGAATLVHTYSPALGGNTFGMDFDPVTDLIRVVNDSGYNVRLNPNGTLAGIDTTLNYDAGDPNAAATPSIVAVAYSNNVDGASVTTLYDIDAGLGALSRQGGLDGSTPSPDSGTLFTIGSFGIDTTFTGLDIAPGSGTVFALLTPVGGACGLYTIDLTTGAATLIGPIGVSVADIAVVPAGTLQFSAPTYTANENGGDVTIIVTRTDGSVGAVTVDFSTSDGTALAGSDYTAASGTLHFADGETSKTFTVSLLDDTLVEGDETIALTLNAPTAGAVLGPQNTAVLTLTSDDSAVVNDASCGNGIVESGEECDIGDGTAADTCSAGNACVLAGQTDACSCQPVPAPAATAPTTGGCSLIR